MKNDPMDRLERLLGTWQGEGQGHYPTIESFRYREWLRFESDASREAIHYEQRTVLIPEEEPSHWESGFLLVLEDGTIQLSNSQNGGRVEVLRGHATVDPASGALELRLDSVALANDPRLVRTKRVWTLDGDRLSYTVSMETHTTEIPKLQEHLGAELHRS
jgi:hypothetical protein